MKAENLNHVVTDLYPRLFAFCLSLAKNRQLAEDLCNSSYVRALESLHTVREPKKVRSWLFQLARNLFLDHVKSPKNGRKINIDDEGKEIALDSFEDSPTNRHFVRQVLGRMDQQDRQVLWLVDSEGYSYQEAARRLRCTECAVRSRLFRARQAFKSQAAQM